MFYYNTLLAEKDFTENNNIYWFLSVRAQPENIDK